jgi:hypothetical protein
MRLSVALPAAFASFLLPFAIGCSLTGGVEQVPEGIAQRIERAKRVGPTADRPLEVIGSGLLSSDQVEARFAAPERANQALVDANTKQDRALARAGDDARADRLALEAVAAEQALRIELLSAEAESARARQLEAETARAELAAEVLEIETAAVARERLANERRAEDLARADELEARVAALDARVNELAPLPEYFVRLEQSGAQDRERIEALENANAVAGGDGGARFARVEETLASLALGVEALRTNEPAGVAELRERVAALSAGGALADGSGATLADTTTWKSLPWLMELLLIAVLVVAFVVAFVWLRRRAEHDDTRLARLERSLDGLGQRLEVVAERTRELREQRFEQRTEPRTETRTETRTERAAAPTAPAAPAPSLERRVERAAAAPEPRVRSDRPTASIIAAAAAAATSGSAPAQPTRWERFVDRVENPRDADAEPVVEPVERVPERKQRVLDQVFLDQYRGRSNGA